MPKAGNSANCKWISHNKYCPHVASQISFATQLIFCGSLIPSHHPPAPFEVTSHYMPTLHPPPRPPLHPELTWLPLLACHPFGAYDHTSHGPRDFFLGEIHLYLMHRFTILKKHHFWLVKCLGVKPACLKVNWILQKSLINIYNLVTCQASWNPPKKWKCTTLFHLFCIILRPSSLLNQLHPIQDLIQWSQRTSSYWL